MDKIRKRQKQSGSNLVETALIITLIALAFIPAGDAFSNSLANSLCMSVGKFKQAETTWYAAYSYNSSTETCEPDAGPLW
jgi:Flp pilus assembly pilin Flp